MAGFDPASLATGAVSSGLQSAFGLGQLLFSGKKKAERKLENFTNSYKPNAGIMDYYNKALARYSTNPYTSSLYQQQAKSINRNLAAGINSLHGRGSANAGISSLIQSSNDASLKAAGAAEGQQSQALGLLGNATQMKAAEEFKPFEMKYNLLAQKASGANKTAAAGIQNVFGGINSFQDQMLANSMYGNGRTKKDPWSSDGNGFNSQGYATGVF